MVVHEKKFSLYSLSLVPTKTHENDKTIGFGSASLPIVFNTCWAGRFRTPWYWVANGLIQDTWHISSISTFFCILGLSFGPGLGGSSGIGGGLGLGLRFRFSSSSCVETRISSVGAGFSLRMSRSVSLSINPQQHKEMTKLTTLGKVHILIEYIAFAFAYKLLSNGRVSCPAHPLSAMHAPHQLHARLYHAWQRSHRPPANADA